MNIHKNARLTFARRLEMVKELLEQALEVAVRAGGEVTGPDLQRLDAERDRGGANLLEAEMR